MNIFVPYTQIQTATKIALIGYDYTRVEVKGDYGFSEFFKQRWQEGQSFVMIEHDCVPWPGAIDELIKCPEPWCAFNYGLPIHRENPIIDGTTSVPLGCCKFSAEFISETQGIWDQPIHWQYCDQQIPKTTFKVHQHFPGIINANPDIIRSHQIN